MGDTSCVIQSFQHSSIHQGDPVTRALTESVSFGRFVTETLEWNKWSTFNQNRYLEEAKRFSKPGLVAQKKALFEAHFKKIAADKAAAAAAALREVEASNLSTNCVDSESVKFFRHCSADAAQNRSEADGSSVLDISSQSVKVYCDDRNDSPTKVSVFVSENNSDDPANSVHIDEPCDKMGALCDTTKFSGIVVETRSSKKFELPDCVKTELDLSEVVNNSSMLLDDPQKKIAAQELVDQIVVASDGKAKPIVTCSKTLTSVTKPAFQSNLIPRPPAFPRKENDTTQNTRSFRSATLYKKRVTTKPLHMSVNLDSDRKRPLAPKKLDSATSSASLRGSRVALYSVAKECLGSGHVSTNIRSHKKQATASDSLSAIRKSSAELYIRQKPSWLKRDETLTNRDKASMRHALYLSNSKTKPLNMSVNLDSHVGEKERLVSLQKTGNEIDATTNRTSSTKSAHAPGNQVIPDRTMRRKQIVPVSNSSADVRKLITQFHAKPAPRQTSNGVQSNSALTLSQNEPKKSKPKSLHMSVDLSSTAGVIRKPTMNQIKGNYCINAPTIRASKDGSIQVTLKESIQTVDRVKDSGKCPPHKMDRPETPRNLIRPPSPTVSKPFRFRSDERAAIRKILEEKCKVESENSQERKGKLPLSRPQSRCARKPDSRQGEGNKKLQTSSEPSYSESRITSSY